MSKSVRSNANPIMLEWARSRAGLSLETVAHVEKIEIATLKAWESGVGSPSLAKLRKLAARYKFPLMTFYLPDPPQEFSPVRDFRTIRNGRVGDFSPELRFAIRQAQERQAWAADYLEGEGASPISLVNSAARKSGVRAVADKIRSAIGVTIAMQSSMDRPERAYSLWREHIEAAGFLVFQSQGIAIEEMRGFALPNPFAPVIAVNSKDTATAKSFTLIHEIAHLVLGESAITGAGPLEVDIPDGSMAESFCNRVAAETLMPQADILPRIPKNWMDKSADTLSSLARIYHVSRAAVAIRMVELGLADHEFIKQVFSFISRNQTVEGAGDKQIPQYRLAISRNGAYFSRLAISAFHSGEIHGGELSALLGIKLGHLPKLESKVLPERTQTFA